MSPPRARSERSKAPHLRKRFSSIEPRSPSAPTTPNGNHEGFNIYPLPDEDDDVFHNYKNNDLDLTPPYTDAHASTDTIVPPPPTPGTAPALKTASNGSFLHRSLRSRDVLLIAVGVTLFIGLAVGTAAVVVIFANNDSSSQKSSSQTSNRTSTTTAIPNTDHQYRGYLYLSEPWEGNVSALETSISEDIHVAMQDTPIYHSYYKTAVSRVSDSNLRVDFNMFFNQSLETDLNMQENIAARIQSIVRRGVVDSQDSLKLNYDSESIVIVGDIPTPMSSSVIPTTQPTTSSSSSSSASSSSLSSSSLSTTPSTEAPGQCLPLTEILCHSFGQTFHLPNTLNHQTEDLARAEFAKLANPVRSADCSDSTLLYFCTLLFPPCDEEGVPMPPCDSLCNVVKNECDESIDLGVTSCDKLPSDHCTVAKVSTTPTTSSSTQKETSTKEPASEVSTVSSTADTTDSTTETTSSSSSSTQELSTEAMTVTSSPPSSSTESNSSSTRESTSLSTTELTSPLTSSSTTESTTKSTTASTTKSTIASTTESTTASTTKSTTASTTESTTASTTESTTASTTKSSSPLPSDPGSETTSKAPINSSTEYPQLQCAIFEFPPCNAIGIVETVYPNPLFECTDVECLKSVFYEFANSSIHGGCTEDLTFFCSYIFTPCDKTGASEFLVPCRETCADTTEKCKDFLPFLPYCDYYPSKTEYDCIEPQTVTENCVEQPLQICREEGFTMTFNDGWFGNLSDTIFEFETFALPVIQSGCSPYSTFFYCSIFFHPCGSTEMADSPCRRYCKDVNDKCEDRFALDCDMLFNESTTCLHPKSHPSTESPDTTQAPVSTESPTSTASPVETKCVDLDSSVCSKFGYQSTAFPNFWGGTTMEEANKTYYAYAEESVSSGCSKNVLFYVCSVIFPYCEADGQFKLPCTRYCEEVNNECPNLFDQDCVQLSDPNEETCLAPPPEEGCSDTEFKCVHLNKCVPLSTKCNQNNDCGDWSDERDCQCVPEFEVQCAMGLCIPSYYHCNGINECPDYSDESGCECPKNQYKCEDDNNNGTCIMPEWLCDGQFDCPRGDDEYYCHACLDTEFMCNDKSCIPLEQRCDGITQCSDHSDELRCIFESTPFYIQAGWNTITVCADGFDDDVAQLTCEKMGHQSLIHWSRVPVDISSFPPFFKLNPLGQTVSIIGMGDVVEECGNDNNLVAVHCNPNVCGRVSLNAPSLIIGAEEAFRGSWPWLVSLQDYKRHVCGGAIIGPHHILTAAHCVDKYITFENLLILAGSTDRMNAGQTGREYYVRRVVIHPEYFRLEGHDVALVELKTPITYTDFIKPLCLPKKSNVFTRANTCFIAGWGLTTSGAGSPAQYLQETKIALWDTTKCNSSYMWDGKLLANDMCAGYFNGIVAACSGDSGSPVMCQDTFETWRSVGIASYVYKSCSVPTKPMVFTPTQPYLDWINNSTECIFRCDNGTCLFDRKLLCNTVDDCLDKTDETKFCNVTVNCTFSDDFLCGYKSKWSMRAQSDSENRFPLFDHTSGGHPGSFMIGYGVGGDIQAPRIALTRDHCLRFFYHMRGHVRNGMSVSVYKKENGDWSHPFEIKACQPADQCYLKIKRGNQNISYLRHLLRLPNTNLDAELNYARAPDLWLMGTVDLSPGEYSYIYIRPHESRRFSLDDVSLIPGKCENSACLPGEFQCYTYEVLNCLPEELRCNLVIDCDDGRDEDNCGDRIYTCSFDNGILCGLEQDTEDSRSAEWKFVNSSKTLEDLRDHTVNNQFGNVLEISTLYMIDTDQVNMWFYLSLSPDSYCLTFYYVSTSPGWLIVNLEAEEIDPHIVFQFSDRRTLTWMPAQATLPSAQQDRQVKMIFSVIGTNIKPDAMDQVIIIDDISIVKGSCPPIECPTDSLKCEDEDYCLPKDQVCDRIVNCAKRTDEINCECTDLEYKCPTGPCIPKEKTCNIHFDCPDGSDEGSICDHKRTVSCDFRDTFVCGYTVDTTGSYYHWQHTIEPMGGELTGPQSGHTFPGDLDVQRHYFGASSQKPGAVTTLVSPVFESNGEGLVFFYHATHIFNPTISAGKLSVMSISMEGNSEELWSTVPDTVNEWKLQCLDLPEGNISISFVAHKGNADQKADFGIDNVHHLNTSCETFLKDIYEGNGSSGGSQASGSECPPGEKACRDGLCLKEDFFCDDYPDCLDGSDEQNCP